MAACKALQNFPKLTRILFVSWRQHERLLLEDFADRLDHFAIDRLDDVAIEFDFRQRLHNVTVYGLDHVFVHRLDHVAVDVVGGILQELANVGEETESCRKLANGRHNQ